MTVMTQDAYVIAVALDDNPFPLVAADHTKTPASEGLVQGSLDRAPVPHKT